MTHEHHHHHGDDRHPNHAAPAITEKATTHVRPLHDRIVLKRCKAEEKSPGGIIIPDSAKSKPTDCEVVAVGAGKILASGQVVPIDVQVGQIVIISHWSGSEVEVGGVPMLIVREEDILGVREN